MLWLLGLLLTVLIISPAVAISAYQGDVVGIVDGDTIEVFYNQHPERIRLSGIDCPEERVRPSESERSRPPLHSSSERT